jgi:hypothetical protein
MPWPAITGGGLPTTAGASGARIAIVASVR